MNAHHNKHSSRIAMGTLLGLTEPGIALRLLKQSLRLVQLGVVPRLSVLSVRCSVYYAVARAQFQPTLHSHGGRANFSELHWFVAYIVHHRATGRVFAILSSIDLILLFFPSVVFCSPCAAFVDW